MNILQGDALTVLRTLPDESVQCCVTSPPYWGLRDYGTEGQLGLEATPEEYVANMVEVFREVRRVLRSDGTLWLNLGDSYAGSGKGAWSVVGPQKEVYVPDPKGPAAAIPKVPPGLKPKDLVGIPWRVAFALQADGWYLRSDIIWAKPNPMPESVTDRPTKSHEYLFLLSRSERYYYDADAIREPAETGTPGHLKAGYGARHSTSAALAGYQSDAATGRNRRSVWTIATQPYPEAHFATFPEALVEPCIKAGSRTSDVVLDPFAGSGTTLAVAKRLDRDGIGIELNPNYTALAEKRIAKSARQIAMVLA